MAFFCQSKHELSFGLGYLINSIQRNGERGPMNRSYDGQLKVVFFALKNIREERDNFGILFFFVNVLDVCEH